MRGVDIERFERWFWSVRDVAGFIAVTIAVLIFGLWWFIDDETSSAQAARAEIRRVLDDPDVDVGTPRIFPNVSLPGRYSRTLVCGRVAGDRPFAALVEERLRRHRRSVSLLPGGRGDAVEALAFAGPDGVATEARDADLLAACAERLS